eukprot:824860-Rhodomonas_salina.2
MCSWAYPGYPGSAVCQRYTLELWYKSSHAGLHRAPAATRCHDICTRVPGRLFPPPERHYAVGAH